jgi:GNAT superfamily N-acetyltransferase
MVCKANMNVRTAVIGDAAELRRLDQIAATDSRRCELIDGSIDRGECVVLGFEGGIAGYGVLNYSFFHCGFVELLYIREELRHRGLGRVLLKEMEEMCRTSKLFISINASNEAMRNLLGRCGYVASGQVENLDDEDVELIFFKRIRG